MERVVAYEGRPTDDGRIIEPNALRFDCLPVPVVWMQDSLGLCTAVRREEDGRIVATLELDRYLTGDEVATIGITQPVFSHREDDPLIRVREAQLAYIHIGPGPNAWGAL